MIDMPWKGETFLWTVPEKLSDMLQGIYGDENTEKESDLMELVDATRRDWAARLRKLRDEQYGAGAFKAERRAIDLVLNELDPEMPDRD